MSGNGSDPYEVLGVARSASASDVKRAYFRLVKVHTPEDDPERFQAISAAYAVLSDPEARRRYDSEERIPADVAGALDRAAALCEKSPDQSAAAARRVLDGAGRSPAVRFAVLSILLRCGRAEEALPLAQELVRTLPARPDYACALGETLLACARHDAARGVLERAIELDPSRAATYASLSQVYEALERADDALAVLDRGIDATGGMDLRTLPLRARKLYVLALDGRFDQMDRVVTGILSCVPTDDADAVQHAWTQLVWLAQQYDEAGVYDVAKFVLDASLQLLPHPGVGERAKKIAAIAAAQREARRAYKDPRVARWILSLARARIGRGLPEGTFRALCDRLVSEMQVDVGARSREWATFRGRYPLVAAEIEEDWNALHQAATGRAAPPASRRTRRRASGAVNRSRMPVSKSAGALGIVGTIVVGLIVRVVIVGAREATRPAPAHIDMNAYVENLRRNTPSLEELMNEAVAREEASIGRKLTETERADFIDRWCRNLQHSFKESLRTPQETK